MPKKMEIMRSALLNERKYWELLDNTLPVVIHGESEYQLGDVLLSGWQFSPIYTYQSGPAVGFGNVILTSDIHDVPL